MEDFTRTALASRKAEETAWRRFQAAAWLDSEVGPLGISGHPSEKEFVSRLRNGLILCHVINKVHPGAVPKVVENYSTLLSLNRESQPLPAYQYFENVKNFLVAVEELKLPAFEASDLERDTMQAGSTAKVVDCILALKAFHESKQNNNGNGIYKPVRSPLVMNSSTRNNSRSILSDSCRRLDMSVASEKHQPDDYELQKLEDLFVKVLADQMAESKENIDDKLLISIRNGEMDPMKLLTRILSSCLADKFHSKFPGLKSMFKDFIKTSPVNSPTTPLQDLSMHGNPKCHSCSKKGNCNHRHLLKMQEKELVDLKSLLTSTKKDFEDLQSQLQRDLGELGSQVQEMSTAALGYQKVLKENKKLFNMVQDLKGNIRVYCRIRPSFIVGASNVVDFVGEDGILAISDPLKSLKDGRKVFQLNRVFGPTSTQEDVFMDTQPLIRSVMDGYNVCIFSYGQTGSGKTYTMSGPSGGSTNEMGINYLALNDLFQLSNERKDVISYEIQVQMVEIYNEQVRDLLAEDSMATRLEIRSCTGDDGLSLPDARTHSVKSTADVLNLMKLGEVNRAVSSTAMNNLSSRSHSVLTVHVHGKELSGSTLRSSLHLVDLAGSERVDKSEVTGDRLREAQYINKSLSCLGDVITALAQRNSYIPYRNSKLTLLLQDSLGKQAKTLMFAHVSPEGDSYGETVSTLKFAQRVSTVELGVARANKDSSEVLQLKEQVENLKKALVSKEAQNAQLSKMTERTPPRLRRLSIENGPNIKYDKMTNLEDKKIFKTPHVPTRSRRLSLEGSASGKKNILQTKEPDNVTKPLQFEAVTLGSYGHSHDAEALIKPYGHAGNHNNVMEMCPQNPSSHQKRMAKTESRVQIPSLQLSTMPEPQVLARNEVQMMQNELSLSRECKATNLLIIGSTNGKGSQIRKSLRTIGKLINGTEKRNQQNMKESDSPVNGSENKNDEKSPLTANARALRRQSLTGVPPSGSDRSRRSSIGGKPIESDDSRRNARTPPPTASTKATKR